MAEATSLGAAGISVSPEAAGLIRKVAWRLMPLIMVCYFFAFFDRINIGFAKAQLQADLHISNTAYGLGASLFVVGYVAMGVPSNMMLYRVGARRWIAAIMVGWGLATAAMVLVQGTASFYALRLLIGAMEAGFAPGVLYYLTLWFPPAHRGRTTALLFLASALSGAIGGPLAGLVLTVMDHAGGLAGWRWLFLCGGVPSMLLGLVVLHRLDDRVVDASWLTAEERARLSTGIAEPPSARKGHSLLAAVRTPGFLLLGLAYFVIQVGSYGLNFWGPDLIRTASGGSSLRVGLLTAAPYVCGAAVMTWLGRRADASGRRDLYVIGCLIAGAVGFWAAGAFAHDTVAVVLALALIGAGVLAAIPAFWALPPRLMTGAGAAGGIALINTVGQLGGIVSPILVGAVKDATGSTTPALYLIAALCVACAVMLHLAAPASLRATDTAA
ncbi:MAG TPA: MFS transporter [Caulobacteraceae bacterium]|jgi:MFS family permease